MLPRSLLLLIVVLAALAGPQAAGAHSRAPAAALDYRLRLTPTTASLSGVHVQVLDGNRELRLKAEPSVALTVLGLVGEPFPRFGRGGVWVNAASPTAAADKLLPSRGPASGWIQLTRAPELTWHDHRLAPPPNLPVGSSAPFALPLTVDGRSAVLRGSFTHVTRPRLWPWLLGVAIVVAALAATARAAPRIRGAIAASAAAVASLAALASSAGFATGESITRLNLWLQVGSAAVLALGAVAVLRLRKQSTRTWWAMVIGVIAAALSLGSIEVFWHGVVLSSLPPALARLATGAAVVGGVAAAVIALLDGIDEPPRREIAARSKAVAR